MRTLFRWAAYLLGFAALCVLMVIVISLVLDEHLTLPVWITLVVVAGIPVYLLPTWVAYAGKAPDRLTVFVVNVLLGWTFFGWCIALALAVRDPRPQVA